MRLTQLQYLVEIKKQGSISKAAQHLYIAQPSMSTAIRELEEELGYELMKRSKRGVTFTNLGEQAVQKAELIMQEVEALRCLDQVDTGHMSGRIFISAVPFVCEYFIVDLIVTVRNEHPDLLLLLDETDGASVIQQVSRREADIGVIMICNNEEIRFEKELAQNNLAFEEIFHDEMVFLVSANNSLYLKEKATMYEVLQYPYVYYKDSLTEEDKTLFAEYCDLAYLQTVCMKDQASIKKYLQHSQATTVAPYKAAKNNIYLQYEVLYPIRLLDVDWRCRIGVVYRKDHALTREELFLLEKMHQQAARA